MPSLPFYLRLLAACSLLSGVAFAKPVIQISGEGDGFVATDYSYQLDAEHRVIRLKLSPEDAARLNNLSRKELGKSIVVAIGGTKVGMPVVRDVIVGPELEVSFADAGTFAAVEEALAQ